MARPTEDSRSSIQWGEPQRKPASQSRDSYLTLLLFAFPLEIRVMALIGHERLLPASRVRTSDFSYRGERTRKAARLQAHRCAPNNGWN